VEVGDLGVAQGDQVLDGQRGAGLAVVVDRVDHGGAGGPGDEHDGGLLGGGDDRGRGHHGAEQGQPGGAEGEQAAQGALLAAGAAAAGVDDDLEALGTGHGVQSVDDFGEEGVVQVGDHHAEHGGG